MAGRNKNSQVLLIDVSRTMHDHLNDISTVVSGYLVSKMLRSPGHELGLVLYGTSGTNNRANAEVGDDDQYLNIEEVWPLQVPAKKELAQARGLPRGTGRTDVCEALVVAINQFQGLADNKKSSGASSIVLISNFLSETEELDPEFLDSLMDRMNMLGIMLEVVFVKQPDEETPRANMAAVDHLLAKMGGGGKMREVGTQAEMLSCFRAREVAPTTVYRGPLSFTPDFYIPVWVYKKTSEVTLPSMKRYSDQKPFDDPSATHDVVVESELKSSANPELVVPPEDRVKAYPYGKQMVPMDEAQEQHLKFKAEKVFCVLGFVDASQAPRHHYMQDTNVVVAEPGSEKASQAVSAVVQAMSRTGQVALVKAAWRNGATSVVLGVLTPFPGKMQRADCLLFNTLPFMEDHRSVKFSSFNNEKVKPSPSQYAAAAALIDGMALDRPGEKEELRPESTNNPSLAYFCQALADRMLDPGVPAAVSFEAQAILKPLPAFRNSPSIRKAAESLCPARPEGGQPPGNQASAALPAGGPHADAAGRQQPPASLGSGLSSQLQETAQAPTISIHTPLQDFRELVKDPETRDAGIKGMEEVICTLVQESIGSRFYMSAVECVKALRDECAAFGLPHAERFNSFLKELKQRFHRDSSRGDFWALLVDARLTLITGSLVPGCSATEDEAQAMLRVEEDQAIKEETQQTHGGSQAGGCDDFDGME